MGVFFISLAQTLGAAKPSTAASGEGTCEKDEGSEPRLAGTKGIRLLRF